MSVISALPGVEFFHTGRDLIDGLELRFSRRTDVQHIFYDLEGIPAIRLM